jgi:hypothetical protein
MLHYTIFPMMLRLLILSLCACMALSCSNYDPLEALSEQEYQQLVLELTPYVTKKPDKASYADRFSHALKPYYAQLQEKTGGMVRYYTQKDSLHYFYYVRRDYTSLFEHYYGYGGVFKKNSTGNIRYLNLYFQTSRLTKEEEQQRGKELFEEMVVAGNVEKYLGNRDYIKTPNADFYYNDRENRWEYTENSSWKFLQEAKEYAATAERE